MPTREFRFNDKSQVRSEFRSEPSGWTEYVSGYAATFGTLSRDLGGWYERIMPGTFSRAIARGQDVRCLIDHEPSLILGRTAAGTLQLSQDAKGLFFRCAIPNTSYAKDLVESMKRGDVNECSFGFTCLTDSWVKEGKQTVREVSDLDLFDTTICTFPAYPNTSAGTDARAKVLFPDSGGTIPAEIRSHIVRPQDDEWMSRARIRLRRTLALDEIERSERRSHVRY